MFDEREIDAHSEQFRQFCKPFRDLPSYWIARDVSANDELYVVNFF